MTINRTATAALALAALAPQAHALEPIASIDAVSSIGERDSFRICTGSPSGAYYGKALDLSGRVGAAVGKLAEPHPGGGTVGCLRLLAAGDVDAAIIQRDGLAWLYGTKSPLLGEIDYAGDLLTEDFLAFCNRNNSEDDAAWLTQDDAYAIAIAGGPDSGTNLFLNVLAGFDSDWAEPRYSYADTLDAAMTLAADGLATCAVAVMSVDAEALETLDDQYADRLSLRRTWDSDIRRLSGPGGEQVYGWRYVNEDHEGVDDFLSWDNDGDTWSPYVIGVNAGLVIRRGAAPADAQSAIRAAVRANADLRGLED